MKELPRPEEWSGAARFGGSASNAWYVLVSRPPNTLGFLTHHEVNRLNLEAPWCCQGFYTTNQVNHSFYGLGILEV